MKKIILMYLGYYSTSVYGHAALQEKTAKWGVGSYP
jgi:hypothetical protein